MTAHCMPPMGMCSMHVWLAGLEVWMSGLVDAGWSLVLALGMVVVGDVVVDVVVDVDFALAMCVDLVTGSWSMVELWLWWSVPLVLVLVFVFVLHLAMALDLGFNMRQHFCKLGMLANKGRRDRTSMLNINRESGNAECEAIGIWTLGFIVVGGICCCRRWRIGSILVLCCVVYCSVVVYDAV